MNSNNMNYSYFIIIIHYCYNYYNMNYNNMNNSYYSIIMNIIIIIIII